MKVAGEDLLIREDDLANHRIPLRDKGANLAAIITQFRQSSIRRSVIAQSEKATIFQERSVRQSPLGKYLLPICRFVSPRDKEICHKLREVTTDPDSAKMYAI